MLRCIVVCLLCHFARCHSKRMDALVCGNSQWHAGSILPPGVGVWHVDCARVLWFAYVEHLPASVLCVSLCGPFVERFSMSQCQKCQRAGCGVRIVGVCKLCVFATRCGCQSQIHSGGCGGIMYSRSLCLQYAIVSPSPLCLRATARRSVVVHL